jgi:hypothetical protein
MGALVVLREQVLKPLLTAATTSTIYPHPTHWTALDQRYETVRLAMSSLLTDLGVAA